MALRSRNAVVLAKIETTSGVFNAPAASTDAVLVRQPRISFNPNNQTSDEVTGSLDSRGPTIGGMSANIDFGVYIKGQGAAGTAPEWGKLLRACGWAETVTATAVPAAPEACAAGSVTTATLGATAVATAQAYRGMPVNITGTPAGANGIGLISDYTAGKVATLTDTRGTAIAATNSYQILPNVRYQPASINIPSLSLEVYMDGLRYQFQGARGNFSMEWNANAGCLFNFQFKGMYLGRTDTAVPAATYDATRPGTWRNSSFLLNRTATALSKLMIDNGNQLAFADNPNQLEGFDVADIVSRTLMGDMDPLAVAEATRSIMADWRSSINRIMSATLVGGAGSVAGNRIGLTVPAVFYTESAPGDASGLITEQTKFFLQGQDSGCFLTVY